MTKRFRHAPEGEAGPGWATPKIINAMGVTITTNVGGDATYTFPTAFPNGLYGFQITEATVPAALGAVVIKAYPQASGFSDRTKVAFRAYASTTGAAIASTAVTVNITAYGW